MKKDIHPKYYTNAKITCACGAVYSLGATKEAMEVEICGLCHPFYTGQGGGTGRGSRVERFRKRIEKHEVIKTTRTNKTRSQEPNTKKASGAKVLKKSE